MTSPTIKLNLANSTCAGASFAHQGASPAFIEPRHEKSYFFYICQKGVDQLCGYRAADKGLSFRFIDSTIPLLPISKRKTKGKSVSGVSLVTEGAIENSEIDDINLFWQFVRMAPTQFIHTPDNDISQPTWRSFNDFLIVKESPATIIGYGQLIPKSPTDAAVVASSLEYCMIVASKVGQEHAIVTCDQAIYEIALGLRKKNPAKYEHLILRMGGFHIASNFLGAIGYLMRSSGIEDILSQAEICLAGTAKKIMSGKDYYLMVRAHTLISTAMFELLWEALENWLIEESAELEAITKLDTVIDNILEALVTCDKERGAEVCFSNNASGCIREI